MPFRLVPGLAAVVAIAAVTLASLHHGERAPDARSAAVPASSATIASLAERATAPRAVPPPSTRGHAVITQPCRDCRSTIGSIAKDMTLEKTGGIDLPSGARLSLALSISDTPEDGVADLLAVVDGPARAVPDGKGGIRLEYGRAKIVAARASAMTTPFATFTSRLPLESLEDLLTESLDP